MDHGQYAHSSGRNPVQQPRRYDPTAFQIELLSHPIPKPRNLRHVAVVAAVAWAACDAYFPSDIVVE